jgi:hypothetical protein
MIVKEGIVWDIEANGLIEEATEIWCISSSFLGSENIHTLQGNSLTKDYIYDMLVLPKMPIIGHYIINYDIPMIKKFFGIDLIKELGNERIIDTNLFSQVLHPDRQLPKGCPTSIPNPVNKSSKKITPHSLEAWGYRCGRKKIEIHDWRTFTPDIINRCEEDVQINKETYRLLLKEAGVKDE